jgi:hypothetical protein
MVRLLTRLIANDVPTLLIDFDSRTGSRRKAPPLRRAAARARIVISR